MSIVAELEDVLKREQDSLLKGDFAALGNLIERKAALAERLSKKRPDLPEEVYRHLVDQASKNEALLSSAQRGLQAAMSQIRHATQTVEQTTYSQNGERQKLSRKPSSVTQKA